MERDYRTLLRNERIPFAGMRNNGVDSVTIELRVGGRRGARRGHDPPAGPDPHGDDDRERRRGSASPCSSDPTTSASGRTSRSSRTSRRLRNRVDELGVAEPIVARQGLNRILVQLPGVQDPNEALRVLGATATLEFRLVDDQNDPVEAERLEASPARLEALPASRRRAGAAQARGHRLRRAARRREHPASARASPRCSSSSTRAAPREMLETTRTHLGRPMAVVFIEKKRLTEQQQCTRCAHRAPSARRKK